MDGDFVPIEIVMLQAEIIGLNRRRDVLAELLVDKMEHVTQAAPIVRELSELMVVLTGKRRDLAVAIGDHEMAAHWQELLDDCKRHKQKFEASSGPGDTLQ
jgi:hypothetical protein